MMTRLSSLGPTCLRCGRVPISQICKPCYAEIVKIHHLNYRHPNEESPPKHTESLWQRFFIKARMFSGNGAEVKAVSLKIR